MKKKHIYAVIPLIALGIFIAYYLNFSAGYDRHQAQIEAKARHDRDEAIRLQNRQREKAVQMALAEQEQRKKEREDKEAAEAKRKEDRANAYQARDQSNVNMSQNRDKVDRLEKDVALTKEQIAKIEADEKVLREDKVHVLVYVQKAQENVHDLTAVLDKIAKADAANAAAKAAAAIAAKNKKSSS